MRRLLLLLLLALSLAAAAAIDPFRFDTPEQEARFQRLAAELRCLVCQNQSLADSNAGLALDLRRQVHQMILAGRSDDQIIGFMVERYGEFVLYRPQVQPRTWLLWFGPLGLLAAGGVTLLLFVRRRAAERRTTGAALSREEQARLDALLEDEEGRP